MKYDFKIENQMENIVSYTKLMPKQYETIWT